MRKRVFDIYVMDIFRLLRKKWKSIALITCVVTVLGIIIAIFTPSEYTSQVKVAPEGLRSSTGMSDLAALAGVDVNMASRSDAISPMVYPDVISSVPFTVKLSQIAVPVETGTKSLYDYASTDMKAPLLDMLISVPMVMVNGVRSIIGSKNGTSAEDTSQVIRAYRLTEMQEKILSAIAKRITIDVDKKKRIIVISVQMQDPQVSAVVADSVVSFLNDYITSYRTEKAKRDYEFTAGLVAKAKQDYYSAQSKYARYSDENNNVVKSSSTIERDRLFNEQQLAFSVYSNLSQQMENAKIKVQEQTPCISMIEPARIPVYKSNMSKMAMVGVSFLLGFVVSVCFTLIRNYKSLLRIHTQPQ